ncbi:MAG: hypothetical protein U1F43_33410, partial [Myxococcota bacterium]
MNELGTDRLALVAAAMHAFVDAAADQPRLLEVIRAQVAQVLGCQCRVVLLDDGGRGAGSAADGRSLEMPLQGRSGVLGRLELSRAGDPVAAPFDEAERRLAESLATHAALAIAKSRLFARHAREIEERTRMETRLRLI